jgi:cytochrome c oxidase subunit 4
MEQKNSHKHTVTYGTYVLIWFGLLVLTGLTVTVTGIRLGILSIFTALLIASCKSGLVLYFFMHLRYESRFFKIMLFIALAAVTLFIGFTFLDLSYR